MLPFKALQLQSLTSTKIRRASPILPFGPRYDKFLLRLLLPRVSAKHFSWNEIIGKNMVQVKYEICVANLKTLFKSPHRFPQNTSNESCGYWRNGPHNKHMIASNIEHTCFRHLLFWSPSLLTHDSWTVALYSFRQIFKKAHLLLFLGLGKGRFSFLLAQKRAIATRTRLTERTYTFWCCKRFLPSFGIILHWFM